MTRSLLTITRHDKLYHVSEQVREVVLRPYVQDWELIWLYDEISQGRYFLIRAPWQQEWRVKITAPDWYRLTHPDVEVQFEAICKLRDLVNQVVMRMESTQRGGYA